MDARGPGRARPRLALVLVAAGAALMVAGYFAGQWLARTF